MRILRQNPHSIHRDDFPESISAKGVIWLNATQGQYVLDTPIFTYGEDIFINAVPADEVHGRVSVFDSRVGESGGVYSDVVVRQSRCALIAGFRDTNNYLELRTLTSTDLHDEQGWSATVNDTLLSDIPTPNFPQSILIPPTAGNLPSAFDFVAVPLRRDVGQRFVLCRAWERIQLAQIKNGEETILAETAIPYQLQRVLFNVLLHTRLSVVRQPDGIAKIVGCHEIIDGLGEIRHFFVRAEIDSAECGNYCGVRSFFDYYSTITFRCLDEFNTKFVANNRKPASEGNDFADRHSDQSLLSATIPSRLAAGDDEDLQWLDASAGEAAWRAFPTLYHGSKASLSVLVENTNNWPSWSMVPQSPRTTLTVNFREVLEPEYRGGYGEYRLFLNWLPASLEMNAVNCGTDLVFTGQFSNHEDTRYPLALSDGFWFDNQGQPLYPEVSEYGFGPAVTVRISGYFVLVISTQFSKRSIFTNRHVHEWSNTGSFRLYGMVSVFQEPRSFEGAAPVSDVDIANRILHDVYGINPTVPGFAGWNVIESDVPNYAYESFPDSGLWSPELLQSPRQINQAPVALIAEWYRPGSGVNTGAGAGSGDTPQYILQNYWGPTNNTVSSIRRWPFAPIAWWIEPN